MTVRAVVFDIGGVLELTPDRSTDARWSRRLGLTEAGFAERTGAIWRDGAVGRITLDEVHERLAGALAVDSSTVDELMADIWVEYLGTPNTELIAYVASLRPARRTAILSNSFVGAREKEHEAYGFSDLVDELVYSHEVGLSKPDPAIYALTCDRLGVPAAETVFVDDVASNVEAARAYGMAAVLFTSTAQTIAAVRAHLGE